MKSTTSLKHHILILIVGVPGSGKTTIGKKLSERIIDSAFCSKDMFQSAFTQKRGGTKEYEMISEPTVRFLLSFADTALSTGKTPIIDAPYAINNWRQDKYADFPSFYRKIAEKNNTQLVIIRCLPESEDALKERLRKRGYKRDNHKLEHWDKFRQTEPQDFPIPHDTVLELVNSGTVDEAADKIIDFLFSLER